MKAKQYLSQAQALKKRYQRALEDLEYIRSMATGLTGIRYDKDQVQVSPDNDQMANYMIKLEKAEARALKAAEEYFGKYEIIRMQIDICSPQLYCDVLYMRYIQGMKLWQIADKLGYEYDYIRAIHGKALKEFAFCFPDELK